LSPPCKPYWSCVCVAMSNDPENLGCREVQTASQAAPFDWRDGPRFQDAAVAAKDPISADDPASANDPAPANTPAPYVDPIVAFCENFGAAVQCCCEPIEEMRKGFAEMGNLALGNATNGNLTYRAVSDNNLQANPADATHRVALVECYVNSHPMGGSDKVKSGHRFDTIGIANGLKHAGLAVDILFYNVIEHDRFFAAIRKYDAVIMRINPGQITANRGDQQRFDKDMTTVAAKIPVWPTPANMELMGAKDALTKIKDMDFGLADTLGYYSPDDFKTGFPKTIAFQKRVVKQNRGSSGEGIWIIELKSGKYCSKFGERSAAMDEVLVCKEANDNHEEEHTVEEFIEWCVNGRTDKSGEWESQGKGNYFEGGVGAGGQMVDQRYLPRISEGEARFIMIGRKCFRVEHYVYIGGVGGETKTTIYPADSPAFPGILDLTRQKLEGDLDKYLEALGLSEKDIPLLWAADFIPLDDHRTGMVIGEFNCSCLGLAGFLDARGKDLMDLSMRQHLMGQQMADKIGTLAAEQLREVSKESA